MAATPAPVQPQQYAYRTPEPQYKPITPQAAQPQAPAPKMAEVTPKPRYVAPVKKPPMVNDWAGVELSIIGDPSVRLKSDHQLYMVQLGAFSSHEGSEKAWNAYRKKIPHAIIDYSAVSTPINKSGRTLYHLRVGPFDRKLSGKVCKKIKNGCFPIKS